ncbi:hypothetical protein MD484_g5674, partial [Candolleomyces efflorescens]
MRCIEHINSFDYNIEESFKNAETHIDQSITAIKASVAIVIAMRYLALTPNQASHPSLEESKARPRRGLSGALVIALDVGIPVITVLKDAVEIIGAVPFLKPVFAAVLVMSQAARQTQSNYDGILALSTIAGDFALNIAERCATLKALPPELDDAVKRLESRLRAIASRCQAMSQKSFISSFFQATAFKDELDDLRRSLDAAIQDFQNANLIDIQGTLQSIASHVEWVRLDALPNHPDMSGKLAEYLVESRTTDVEYVCDWIENSGELLLCIHGSAGVGKSTLAGHLSKELRVSGRLAGSIFLGTFQTDTSGPETVIKMLAHEIGSIHPQTRPKILDAMQQCHGSSLDTHLQKYILEPLQSLNYPHPLVIIVDALDEWKDHAIFLSSLGYLNCHTSVVKVIGTGRLNPIASYLPGISKVSVRPYLLSPVSIKVIKEYFENHLDSVPWVDGRRAHPPDIDKLAELSGGLPVWAATVIALLSYPFSELPPHQTLAEIVGSRLQVGGSDALGHLYQKGLERLFDVADIQREFRLFFGAIIALQAPLSITNFSALTDIPVHLVKKIRAALAAFQTRPPPPGSGNIIHPATALFHLSLIEHLQAAGLESPFAISTSHIHDVLGSRCLKQLTGLSPPDQESHLSAIQDYAVRYSLYHVSNGTSHSNDGPAKEPYSLLQTMPASTQQQWAKWFHKAVIPGDDELEFGMDDGLGEILKKLAYRLGALGGDQWGLQVACLEVAVRIDDGDAEAWSRLGRCYSNRGDRMSSIQMRDAALAASRRALELRPEWHPDHSGSLDDVANALWSCFQLNGNQVTLREAISCSRKGLTLCPVPHADRNLHLSTLANTLDNLYQQTGDLETLKEAISLCRERLDLCPASHPNHSTALNNLATALQSLHAHEGKGDTDALKEATKLHRKAVLLFSAPHPNRSSSLSNLASVLADFYDFSADEKALNEAISLYHEALALRPAPHPGRSATLYNLARSLGARYQRDGDISALNECISLYREAVGLRPAPHPDRHDSLNNLAAALSLQLALNQDVRVLDEIISLCRELRLLVPPTGHRYSEKYLGNLVRCLEKRREVTGDDQDQEEIEELNVELAELERARRRTGN